MAHPDARRLWNGNAPAWTELSRAGYDVYRDLLNTPAFFAMLPRVAGLVGLDLGCGEGHNTRLLARTGADVVALDIAEVFVERAVAESPLTETWIFRATPPHVCERHKPFTATYARRTLAGWINAVLQAGLAIEAVNEPHADTETAATHPEVADTRIAPYSSSCGHRKRNSDASRVSAASTPEAPAAGVRTWVGRPSWRCARLPRAR